MVSSDKTWRVKKDRKRATTQRKSCDTCHKSKTRCDRRRPVCSTCEIFGRACTYLQRDQDGAPEPHSKQRSGDAQGSAITIPPPQLPPPQQQHHLHHHHHLPYARDHDFMPAEVQPLPQLSSSSTKSSSPDDILLERAVDDLWNYSFNSVELHAKLPAAGEPLLPCSWCLDFSCDHCRQLERSIPDDQDLLHDRDVQISVAELLMDAMASRSDRESATILAAVRAGIPRMAIYAALISPDCSNIGLTQVLEHQQGSITQQYDAVMSNAHDQIWHQLRYEPTTAHQDGPPTEVAGDLKHPRRRHPMGRPAPSLQSMHSSLTDAGKDVCIPQWAILPPRTLIGAGDTFDDAMATMQAEIAAGADIEAYCGAHAYLGALLHPRHSHATPRLSQIIAGMLARLLPDEVAGSVTSLALMWLHWCVWSWLLSPTEEKFNRIPSLLKPTPWQICRPHTLVYDFVIVPALRDHLCNNPLTNNVWLTEAGNTMLCCWPKTALHALCRNPITKAIDLHPDCKSYAGRPQNWSFGPVIRTHFPDMDRYASIRSNGSPV
ncbi:hypothetical protein AMS68_005853 [Peltaster fructicola]|uniref:Zn(2)-C6 fungal-type domain-containing protein n=1 Tax=Peltaster fructicola TaxID=286661 RepID=A0A6H0Y075_9PEZI|nr:hypothetical protein AMS68_005853 [Peltaster fructicola]